MLPCWTHDNLLNSSSGPACIGLDRDRPLLWSVYLKLDGKKAIRGFSCRPTAGRVLDTACVRGRRHQRQQRLWRHPRLRSEVDKYLHSRYAKVRSRGEVQRPSKRGVDQRMLFCGFACCLGAAVACLSEPPVCNQTNLICAGTTLSCFPTHHYFYQSMDGIDTVMRRAILGPLAVRQ